MLHPKNLKEAFYVVDILAKKRIMTLDNMFDINKCTTEEERNIVKLYNKKYLGVEDTENVFSSAENEQSFREKLFEEYGENGPYYKKEIATYGNDPYNSYNSYDTAPIDYGNSHLSTHYNSYNNTRYGGYGSHSGYDRYDRYDRYKESTNYTPRQQSHYSPYTESNRQSGKFITYLRGYFGNGNSGHNEGIYKLIKSDPLSVAYYCKMVFTIDTLPKEMENIILMDDRATYNCSVSMSPNTPWPPALRLLGNKNTQYAEKFREYYNMQKGG